MNTCLNRNEVEQAVTDNGGGQKDHLANRNAKSRSVTAVGANKI